MSGPVLGRRGARALSVTTKPPQHMSVPWGSVLWLGGTAAGIVGLAIHCAASGAERYVETGDTYPGLSVSWAATAGYFLAAICGCCVVGGIVFLLMGARPEAAGNIDAAVYRVHLLVHQAAIGWTITAAMMVVVSAADSSGVGIGRLLTSGAIADVVTALGRSSCRGSPGRGCSVRQSAHHWLQPFLADVPC